MKRLLRFAITMLTLALPATVIAQNPDDMSISRGTKLDASDQKPDSGKETPIFAYLIAIIGSGGILFIVCSPSRKN